MVNMAGELVPLDEINRLTEALLLREPKTIAKCVLSIKLLEVEVKNQLLELMEAGDDFFKEPFTPAPVESKVEENGLTAEPEIETPPKEIQDVLTAPKTPITGKLQVVKRTFDCSECDQTFNSRAAQRKHVDEAHAVTVPAHITENGTGVIAAVPPKAEANPLPKPLKGSGKTRPPKVVANKRKTSQHRKSVCNICNIEVVRCHMARHLRTHTGQKDFKCDECGSMFSRKDKLKDHIKRHTNPEMKPPKVHKCKRCDFVSVDKHLLKEHMASHPLEMFNCSDCDKTFSCQSSLDQHMIKHKPDRSFMCDFCGVSFSREPNLLRHVKVHTSPAPYKCSFCDKPYYRRNELQIHERSHTGEKPFICERCGASYSSSKYLNRHMMDKHSGLKPWKCEICEKAFSRAENMRAHRKIHDKRPNFGMKRSQKERQLQPANDGSMDTSMALVENHEVNFVVGDVRSIPFNDAL